jgi:hypothetical protein
MTIRYRMRPRKTALVLLSPSCGDLALMVVDLRDLVALLGFLSMVRTIMAIRSNTTTMEDDYGWVQEDEH